MAAMEIIARSDRLLTELLRWPSLEEEEDMRATTSTTLLTLRPLRLVTTLITPITTVFRRPLRRAPLLIRAVPLELLPTRSPYV